ncbi:hypothetical protein [Lichenifustis flavocetrariae]|uniref:Uncharacterized protein n=1 Tax=Lichenifustis flavocetrariae TaxID=2949735 RepID=A0AA42CRV1_9HYPH|nr:hypothetical protein [Lichenifustis flavocetrariae]MCW6512845.1 hypothetical protein [Lichenifustis flavocetrariae]
MATWAEKNYDLKKDVEWTLGLMRRLRQKIRSSSFGPEFSELRTCIACAQEFTRSAVLRRRCAEALDEAERALLAGLLKFI